MTSARCGCAWPRCSAATNHRASPELSKRFGAILDRYATDLPRVAKALGKRHGAQVSPVEIALGEQSEAIEDPPAMSLVEKSAQDAVPDDQAFEDGVLESAPMTLRVNGKRTAVVTAKTREELVPLHADADAKSPVAARLQSGVLGQVRHCDRGWCEISGHGFDGWIEQDRLWGVYPNEKVD